MKCDGAAPAVNGCAPADAPVTAFSLPDKPMTGSCSTAVAMTDAGVAAAPLAAILLSGVLSPVVHDTAASVPDTAPGKGANAAGFDASASASRALSAVANTHSCGRKSCRFSSILLWTRTNWRWGHDQEKAVFLTATSARAEEDWKLNFLRESIGTSSVKAGECYETGNQQCLAFND